jgi:type VII secretion protein EccB
MATKKDLIEAQGFSRRRLLSAFTSGAPGGKELEPAKPLRAVAAGIALTAIVIIGGLFYGLIRPGLPAGWENNALILVKDTGARYISVESVLYPVINTASARLLMPPGEFRVVSTDRQSLEGIRIGPALGIVGAPDDLPDPAALIGNGWGACAIDETDTAMTIAGTTVVAASKGGAVVSRDGRTYVVIGSFRYEVDPEEESPVLRAVGLDTAEKAPVDGRWLNLFDSGARLEPIVVPGAQGAVTGTDIEVGAVVHTSGTPEDERYLMTEAGRLARISPLAYQLYLLGTGVQMGGAVDVSPSEIRNIDTDERPAGGLEWPQDPVAEIPQSGQPCAVLQHDAEGDASTTLGTIVGDTELTRAGVSVAVDGGALVRVGRASDQSIGMVYLVDSTGTAYPVPGGSTAVAQLGYAAEDVVAVPEGWVQFMRTGPSLTQESAGSNLIPTEDGN